MPVFYITFCIWPAPLISLSLSLSPPHSLSSSKVPAEQLATGCQIFAKKMLVSHCQVTCKCILSPFQVTAELLPLLTPVLSSYRVATLSCLDLLSLFISAWVFFSAVPYSPGLVPLLLRCLAPSFTPFFPHCHHKKSTFFSAFPPSMWGQAPQLDLQRVWKALAALERPVWGQWAVRGPGGRLCQ